MRYHNGVLRPKQGASIWLRPETHKHKLTWVEYLPLLVLGCFLTGLFMLMKSIFI